MITLTGSDLEWEWYARMKKFKNITIGGIQQKIFNLVLITIILMMAAFAAVVFYQSGRLTNLVRNTNENQNESITSISEQTMTAVLDANVLQSIQMEAYIAEDLFDDTIKIVNIIADYTSKLFANPGDYPARAVEEPDINKDGEVSLQVLKEEGVDLDDPTISSKLGLIGNLSELMMAVYSDAKIDSCYCALPDGVMLLVDDHSKSKFDDNGNLLSIPIRERLWYTGAVQSRKIHFTDVTTDLFTNEISIMCSIPVYNGEELVAVIGADLFLNDVSAAVNATARSDSFVCIVNQNGHVLFSPQTTGEFRAVPAEEAEDLRQSTNTSLATFVSDAMQEVTDLRLIELEDGLNYVAGAPIASVGWAIISVVPKSLADQPSEVMITQLNAIKEDAVASYNKGISQTKMTIIVLLAVIVILAISASLILSKRIVKPLETITKRIQSLDGDNLQFVMEDEYRTHDEIELLAESFAMLSEKTAKYISEVARISAEKERIGAELSLATRIQADMLPNIYPAFPERPEIDVYASMDPAKEVGGDFYDFFLVDDDHLCIFIADVSGKGVPAALFMMASMIILANNAQMGKSPAQILHDTNLAICSNNREEMFVTVWLGILEISTGKLTAANAGHEYPVVKQPNGNFEIFKDKHGFVIGGIDGAKYKEYDIMLEPGSKLFIYTDGVPEATNSEKELFGMDRMVDALNKAADTSPKEILEAVRGSVNEFVKDAEQFDDLTMLCVEYRGNKKED